MLLVTGSINVILSPSAVSYTVLSNLNLNQLKLLLYFLLKFCLCLSNLSKNILFYSPL